MKSPIHPDLHILWHFLSFHQHGDMVTKPASWWYFATWGEFTTVVQSSKYRNIRMNGWLHMMNITWQDNYMQGLKDCNHCSSLLPWEIFLNGTTLVFQEHHSNKEGFETHLVLSTIRVRRLFFVSNLQQQMFISLHYYTSVFFLCGITSNCSMV